MNAVVISTGNEIIRGTTVDTNSSYISRLLLKHGFQVIMHIVCGDSADHLSYALIQARQLADITIITGGLGPTDDDITVEALCSFFSLDMIHDRSSLDKIERFFTSTGRTFGEKDSKMAAVPAGADIIENSKGLAPGFVISDSSGTVIALPGVPVEMENMMEHGVIPMLASYFSPGRVYSKTLKLTGVKESEINSRVSDLLAGREGIQWGICAGNGVTDLTLSWKHNEDDPGKPFFNELDEIFTDRILAAGCGSPEEELLLLLRRAGLTLSIAESCTGGLIAKRITDIPGSSESFSGGVVAYSNRAKIILLDVPESSITQSGAVSESVAAEMAAGVALKFGSDIGISTTGIAGPGGATETKAVGTVCFGFYLSGESRTFTKYFTGDRGLVRHYSSLFAIDYLRRHLRTF